MDLFFNVTVLRRKKNIVNFLSNDTYHYIIDSTKNKSNCLLDWTEQDSVYKALVTGKSWIVSKTDENKLEIILTKQNDNKKENHEGILKTNTAFSRKEINYEINNQLTIQFFYNDDKGNKKEGTTFIFYKRNKIDKYIKSALDFGSEASQIIQQNDNSIYNTIEPLKMEEVLQSLHNGTSFKFKDYLQYPAENDAHADKFMKSIFLYQSLNAEKDDDKYPSDKFFKFLTKSEDSYSLLSISDKKYKILPNLKLGYLAYNYFTVFFSDNSNWEGEDCIVNVKKMILNNFIEALIRLNKNDEKKLFIQFTLLYPNVYNQKTINKVRREVNSIFENKLINESISGFEINLLAESDAAFLGIKTREPDKIKQRQNYVIIDSGKGTTDYSIINNIDESNYETIRRSGFVGAGNLITFSFLVGLLHDIADQSKGGNDKEYDHLLSGLEISDLIRMSDKLNSMKAHHRTSSYRNSLESIAPTANIMSVLDNTNDIEDKGGYIDAAVKYIVDKIYEDVGSAINSDTQIFLTGRAFKYKPLLDELEKKFINKTTHIKFISDLPKTISLLGAYSSNINSSIAIEGVPREIKSNIVNELKKSDDKSAGNVIRNTFYKALLIYNNLSRDEKNDKNGQRNKESETDFLTKGVQIDLRKDTVFVCSNCIYDAPQQLKNDFSRDNNIHDATIRFDGEKYVVVWNKNVYPLEIKLNISTDTESELIKFSAFPFIADTNTFTDYVNTFRQFLSDHLSTVNSTDWDDIPDL